MSDKFTTTEARASYGIGRQLGDQLANKPFTTFELEAAIAGFIDGAKDEPLQVSAEDINAAFKIIQEQMQAEKSAEAAKLGAAGAEFLADNAGKEGVVVLDSGLQYKVLVEGSGPRPSKESTVRTHYHGTLIDGTIFDSSVDRGIPAEFPVGGVIAGWTEALQLMPTGSKWRLFIPYNLAYGERGAGGKIGPYSTLIFDVELIEILG
ncbi:FKBP-type peptidyl-prolyl cis-trans isomerase [Halioxenophilus sp. WMMB6]|uniref:FKBP-type peptidyl-prolyl cis-trans isomerase n=1 Tax=Halioxenophilus sp. WMMB6 TaxID=3073815 RepID=UPI00295E7412|nr:FKBP-type peptidyl-prolyl cis-trans isomerase [Halioxenophilus sp. WMMB6]